jgi:hypothetical protein
MTKDEIQEACDSLYALRAYARSCNDNIAWHFDTIDKLTDTIRAALQSAQVKAETVDLDALKKDTSKQDQNYAFCNDIEYGRIEGWNDCVDYIAQEHNITRKTK